MKSNEPIPVARGGIEDENPLKLFKFVPIPAGSFLMGSPEDEENRSSDEAQAEVEITKPFEMMETQVTQLQWQSITNSNPSAYKGIQKPVQNISWNDCQAFCEKLNKLDLEYHYRLPTEAEWEYACRSEIRGPYFCLPQCLKDFAIFDQSEGPENVKSKNPNGWGLYDMHGNVWEWCQDWYAKKLKGDKDPQGPKPGSYRVVRGGSWYDGAQFLRSAYRNFVSPGVRYDYLGFRLVRIKFSLSPIALVPSSETREAKVEAILKIIDNLKFSLTDLEYRMKELK